MKYRHEVKQEISPLDLMVLRQRVDAVFKKDENAIDGKYDVHSLYFDNQSDKALKEKMDGVNVREKFRIRYYNENTDEIKLEKKSKINGLCLKESIEITKDEVQKIIDGDCEWMLGSNRPLIQELYYKITNIGLQPKVIVSYTREPFVYEPGNVRITFDYNIRTGILCDTFLEENSVEIPIKRDLILLEIKWDEFLPDIVKDIIQLNQGRIGAFSKYAACRIYN